MDTTLAARYLLDCYLALGVIIAPRTARAARHWAHHQAVHFAGATSEEAQAIGNKVSFLAQRKEGMPLGEIIPMV